MREVRSSVRRARKRRACWQAVGRLTRRSRRLHQAGVWIMRMQERLRWTFRYSRISEATMVLGSARYHRLNGCNGALP